jgi:hypothetical protein
VASTLVANGVTVESVNVAGITGDSGLNNFGQFDGAGSIYAKGVAGTYDPTVDSATDLANAIEAGLTSAFFSYSDVSLDVVGASGVSVSLPSDFTGTFDRSVSRTFDFGDLIITGLTPGVHTFTVNALLDGGIIASETDTITVLGGRGAGGVPEPATWGLMLLGFGGLGAMLRNRRSALALRATA